MQYSLNDTYNINDCALGYNDVGLKKKRRMMWQKWIPNLEWRHIFKRRLSFLSHFGRV
jgi:hypothetical protein